MIFPHNIFIQSPVTVLKIHKKKIISHFGIHCGDKNSLFRSQHTLKTSVVFQQCMPFILLPQFRFLFHFSNRKLLMLSNIHFKHKLCFSMAGFLYQHKGYACSICLLYRNRSHVFTICTMFHFTEWLSSMLQ